MKAIWTWMLGLGLVTVGAGCASNPISGEWEADEKVGGHRNEMSLNETGDGTAKIYAYSGDQLAVVEFSLDYEERGDGRFLLDMSCRKVRLVDGDGVLTECSDVDFEADCKLMHDDTSLECEGDRAWDGYDLTWSKLGS